MINLLFSDILMKGRGKITVRTARFSKHDICLRRNIVNRRSRTLHCAGAYAPILPLYRTWKTFEH
ncbi:MAG: hypothetical protein AUI16_30270 [Alphaproteobacteria bacterium 13_2_20CM_2_64_7]|nr:MAG: hypothetical protein AUI16_30270 [Alphaproteobacteria bacterium 13_2_20CM_2_64_7]